MTTVANPFYVVWCESAGPPTVKHDDPGVARDEAARLARLHPGQTFHVLAVLESATVNPIDWTQYDHGDEIPF